MDAIRRRPVLLWGGLLLVALAASARWGLKAQTTGPAAIAAKAPPSLSAKMTQPLRLPFEKPATLDQVAAYLRKSLGANVVVDRGALKRLELGPETTVQLELDGVRLQTGLKLLLEQVGMSYRVVPEDDLIVITDPANAGSETERLMAEVKAMHREIHDLQDTVDDLFDTIAPEDPQPATRKPTIIEELPDRPAKEKDSPARSRSS